MFSFRIPLVKAMRRRKSYVPLNLPIGQQRPSILYYIIQYTILPMHSLGGMRHVCIFFRCWPRFWDKRSIFKCRIPLQIPVHQGISGMSHNIYQFTRVFQVCPITDTSSPGHFRYVPQQIPVHQSISGMSHNRYQFTRAFQVCPATDTSSPGHFRYVP